MCPGPVYEEKKQSTERVTKPGAPEKKSVRSSALKGKSYEEQVAALRPKEETPSISELYPDHPLLRKSQPSLPSEANAEPAKPEIAVPTPGKQGGGVDIEGTVSTEGANVSVEGKKIRVDLAVLRSPPMNLTEDGMLAAVRINPAGSIRLSAGGGYLPKLYGIVPGPKAVSKEPRVLAFVSIDASGNVVQIPAPAGCTFTLSAEGHISLVAPIDIDPAPGPLGDLGRHLDATAALGMSNVDARADAQLSRKIGEGTTVTAGYTTFVDVLFNAARYEMGGKGAPLASHVVGASLEHKGGAVDADVRATVPLASPTNRLATKPEVAATIKPHSPVLPNVDLRAGPGEGGLHYIGASKDFAVGKASVHVSAGVERPFDATGRDFKASASVRIPIGGGGGGQRAFRHDLYEHVRDEQNKPMPTPVAPSKDEVFSAEERAWLDDYVKRHKNTQATEQDLRELADFLKTPERLAAFHNGYWEYDYERLAKYMGGEGLGYDRSAYSPLESLSLMKSVCCDYSNLWTSMLEKEGYEAHTIAYLGADTGHVVCVYRDKDGKWNVLDNGFIIPVKASTMEAALEQALPEAWCYIEYDKKSDELRPAPVRKVETRDLQRILEFVRGRPLAEAP